MNGDKEILCGAHRGAVSAEAMKAIAKPFLEAKDNRYEAIISLAKERDTYRDLCAELLKELKTLKRSAEKLEAQHKKQSAMFFYYLSGLRESVALSNSAITKAEAILGDKNGR